jgi:uncharacterized membrane protein
MAALLFEGLDRIAGFLGSCITDFILLNLKKYWSLLHFSKFFGFPYQNFIL